MAPWCVHSPLTTCTHDRSKNRGKEVVFITCPRKFNVREILKKGCFGAQCPRNKKNRVFFSEPTTIYASKNSIFSGWFFSFSVGFPSDLALFCSQNSSWKMECDLWVTLIMAINNLWPEIPVWLISNTKCSEKSCPCFCANRGSSGKLSLI